MKPEDDDWDEALFSSLIHSTDREMPPPDPQFLADLRERSTRAFLEAAAANASGSPIGSMKSDSDVSGPNAGAQSSAASPHVRPALSEASTSRKRTMLPFVFKALSGGLAAALVVAAGFWSFFGPHETKIAFGAALDRTTAAQSLHLKITGAGRAGEVWYAQPDLLRWDAADGTYQIARGSTLWRVDESQNLAASEPAAYFGTDAAGRPGVDLLALLEVDSPEARSAIAAQEPVDTIEREGKKLLRYR